MGRTNSSTAGRRYRRARELRRSRRGVVAVVGTLLALLVFFTLFGIFLTQYVPLWMTDNESQLVAQASTSFAQFKSGVDSQVALGGPQTYGSPFVISSQGVPLIAQPTQGTLVFLPSTCPSPGSGGSFYTSSNGVSTPHANYGQPTNPAYCVFANITMSVGPGGVSHYSQSIATGTLQLVLPNRYYTPENFYYEDDGVIQSQSTGYQLMTFPPPLSITNIAGNISVQDSLLQLYGNASSVVGQGSEEVYSSLHYSQDVTSTGLDGTPFTFTFEIGTQYPCAWNSFLYTALTTSGVPAYSVTTHMGYNLSATFGTAAGALLTSTPISSPSAFTGDCFNTNGATTILSFSIANDVTFANVYLGGVQVGIGVGSG